MLDIFPEAAKTARKAYRNITLADLLSHRAGIPPLTDQRDVIKVPRSKGNIMERRHTFALWLLKQRPVPVGPKESYHYSNAGYGLAGALLEQVTGKQWETLVYECLHDSLGIAVHFGWPNRVALHEPWGHWEEADTIRPLPPEINYEVDSLIAPAGNVCMSIGEYAKFIQLQLRGLRGKTNFLPRSEFERMHYGRPEYGFGWAWVDQHGNRVSTHDGSAGTFYCHVALSAMYDVAFIVCCNITIDDTDDQVVAIRHFLEARQF